LNVLALSDSFASLWPELAAECGLTYRTLKNPAELAASQACEAILVAAGGVERDVEVTLRALPEQRADIAVVGAVPDHRLAAALVRAGARDYFALPGDTAALRSWLRERGENARAEVRRREFSDAERLKYRFEGIHGESASLKAALAAAARVIPHAQVTVLLTGETGTGKELLARAIHYNGPRREAPFVDVNCAALPDQLLESELFGHERGAFTDATTAKPGLFEVANGGTLLLDEIGHLPLQLQGKILRALEERVVRRVGGTRAIPVNIRIIAATHVDLADAVRQRLFREDLFYRLNVVQIVLPPLRDRRGDVLMLAQRFLLRFAGEYGVPLPTLTPAAVETLLHRDWPGNVRELRNLMERVTLLVDDGRVDASDLVEPIAARARSELPFPSTIATLERAAARAMLAHCGGNKSLAARRLGISRPRLQRLLDATSDADVGGSNEDLAHA
jgi:two-component system response regulator HydG